MLILLPPSEGKTAATAGAPVDPAGLRLPGLAPARTRVLNRLVALCKRTSERSVADSLNVLGLSAGQRDEVARNATLHTAPAARAAEVYTGVLYEALDPSSLAPASQKWLDDTALVFSGLWGVVGPGDRIPAYRCSIGVTLPPIGGLTSYWKKVLKPALDPLPGPVLDLRSGAYVAMWAPGAQSCQVRVLHERVAGGEVKRSVVSHFNKATKGRLVRALAEERAAPATADELVTAMRDLKFTVEERPAPEGRPRQLDVVVTEI
ncbi:peroxide stress protein YaaA [Actinoplanes sp. NPDC023714]|uniref:peroxide stress protein YaaA n=1 Tax=Actinoplanes sp. NPDC023714 TaxID=3154322 RepID=UPI003410F7E4